MAPKNVYEALKARWKPEWTTLPSVAGLSIHIDRIAEAPASVAAVKEEHVKGGKLSVLGVREKTRELAAATIPDLRRAHYALEQARANVALQRSRLMDPPIDKTDIVGAMVRQEIRAKLEAMDQGQRMKLLMDGDQRVYDAWRELPTFVPVPADFTAELQERRLEERDPVSMERMREANEAIELVDTILRAATDELRDVAEFNKNSKEFEAFFAGAAAPVDAQFAKKPAPVEVDIAGIAGVIDALSHKDRDELIDRALGRQLEDLKA